MSDNQEDDIVQKLPLTDILSTKFFRTAIYQSTSARLLLIG